MITTRLYTPNIKDSADAYLACATINRYSKGRIEYCAIVKDGSRPAPYLDESALQIIQPPSRDKTITGRAGSWRDALEQLQAIADEYGTLIDGAPAAYLVYKPGDIPADE